ncbi:hypothetical protein NIES2104_55970 [Leptolyngbya sp. NIES-2104]|nr:hypothetical protein NIES2104_55970 [Leptolyngbya sp. NIES-2104]
MTFKEFFSSQGQNCNSKSFYQDLDLQFQPARISPYIRRYHLEY